MQTRLSVLAAFIFAAGGQSVWGASILGEQVCDFTTCDSSQASQLVTISASGTGFDMLAKAFAEDYGTLKSYVDLDATSVIGPGTIDATASASDRLFLSGLSGGMVAFTFDISGSNMFALDTGREEVDMSMDSQFFLLMRDGNQVGFPNQALQTEVTVDVAIESVGGATFLDYNPSFTTYLQCLSEPVPGMPQTCSGSGTVDFYDTMQLTHVAVYDSTGTLVSNPTIISTSGFDYGSLTGPPDTSATPEPSTLVVAALGLVAIAARVRRHKRI